MNAPDNFSPLGADPPADSGASMLAEILDEALVRAKADYGTIQLILPQGRFRTVAHRNFPIGWINGWDRFAAHQCAHGWMSWSGGRLVVEDVANSPLLSEEHGRLWRGPGAVRALHAILLRGASGQLLGVLSSQYRHRHQPDVATLRVLDLLASQAAMVLEQIQLGRGELESAAKAPALQLVAAPGRLKARLLRPGPRPATGLEAEIAQRRKVEAVLRAGAKDATKDAKDAIPGEAQDIRHLLSMAPAAPSDLKRNPPKDNGASWPRRGALRALNQQQGRQSPAARSGESVWQVPPGDGWRQRWTPSTVEGVVINAVLDAQDSVVLIFDRDLRLVRFNRAFADMHHGELKSFLGGRQWQALFAKGAAHRLLKAFEQIADGAAHVECDVSLKERKARHRTLLMRSSAIRNDAGEIQYLISSGVDITRLRQVEERSREHLDTIARLHRLQTADELASTLAHEINQPLGAISNYTMVCKLMLDRGEPDPAKLQDVLQRIGEQSLRAGEIIQRMRQFIGRGEVKREVVDLAEVIRSIGRILLPRHRRGNIRLQFQLPRKLLPVFGVKVQIEQVVANLLRNAREAVVAQGEGGGSVTVEVQRFGTMARVTIRDTGPGVSQEKARQMFRNMDSGKADGLGLGLRITRTLVEAQGGRVWVEPQMPGGIFHFELPFAS